MLCRRTYTLLRHAAITCIIVYPREAISEYSEFHDSLSRVLAIGPQGSPIHISWVRIRDCLPCAGFRGFRGIVRAGVGAPKGHGCSSGHFFFISFFSSL